MPTPPPALKGLSSITEVRPVDQQGPPVHLNVTWETPPSPGFLVSRIEVGWGMLEGRKRF